MSNDKERYNSNVNANIALATTATSHSSNIPLPPSFTIETSNEPPRTLWMGDLDPNFDELTIQEIWKYLGKFVTVKLIRAKKNLLIPCSSTSNTSTSNSIPEVITSSSPSPPSSNPSTSPTTSTLVTTESPPLSSDLHGQHYHQFAHTNDNRININGMSFIDPSVTTLHHAGYCFVEFETQEDAQFGLSLNSTIVPNFISTSTNLPTNPTNQRTFRLNWASGATLKSSIPMTPEFSLFVGDLSPTATEADLLTLFQKKFKSVKTVRVMTDPITGASRCFGFVRFGNENERKRALLEMNGVWCQGRCLRVAYATPRNNNITSVNTSTTYNTNTNTSTNIQSTQPVQQESILMKNPNNLLFQQQAAPSSSTSSQITYIPSPSSDIVTLNTSSNMIVPPDFNTINTNNNNINSNIFVTTDPNNTTVFIGGLSSNISEYQLQTLFSPFGKIVSVKIPHNKNCGFVRFENRIDAEASIQGLQGFIVAGNPIRLSWGRSNNSNIINNTTSNVNQHATGSNYSNNNMILPNQSSFSSYQQESQGYLPSFPQAQMMPSISQQQQFEQQQPQYLQQYSQQSFPYSTYQEQQQPRYSLFQASQYQMSPPLPSSSSSNASATSNYYNTLFSTGSSMSPLQKQQQQQQQQQQRQPQLTDQIATSPSQAYQDMGLSPNISSISTAFSPNLNDPTQIHNNTSSNNNSNNIYSQAFQ